MKRLILLAILCASLTGCARDFYARRVTVTELDKATDIVTVEDEQGNLWEFYGAEGWSTGDEIELLMDDNGTSEIQDDIIVRANHR